MKNQMIAAVLIVGITAGGTGFFAGTKFQQSKQPVFTRNAAGGRNFGGGNGGNGGNAFRPINGEIISADDKSITVKMNDGSSKIVLISTQTMINKAEAGTKADLQINTKVAVFGQANSDGSVTAQNIQINPILRMGANPPSASPSPTTK